MHYNPKRLLPLAAFLLLPLLAQTGPAVPSGTAVVILTIESIDSKSAQLGQTFKASLDEPLIVGGQEIARKGSDASLRLVEVKSAGKLTGSAELSIMLVSLQSADQTITINSDSVTSQSSGKGKSSAIKVGAGGALGAGIGGVLGRGKGAAIGAGAGAGAGTVAAMATGPHVRIPPETRLTFKVP